MAFWHAGMVAVQWRVGGDTSWVPNDVCLSLLSHSVSVQECATGGWDREVEIIQWRRTAAVNAKPISKNEIIG